MDEDDIIIYAVLFVCVCSMCIIGYNLYDIIEHGKNFGLGSEVTTTPEYEELCNDSFVGIVVKCEGWRDPALTIRNTTGEERRIATKFLEPVKRV